MTKSVWRARPLAWRLMARRGYPRRFDSLVSRMAEHRTCYPGGGGSFSGLTGDGHAWQCNDRTWARERQIRRGQFIGPWRHKKADDL